MSYGTEASCARHCCWAAPGRRRCGWTCRQNRDAKAGRSKSVSEVMKEGESEQDVVGRGKLGTNCANADNLNLQRKVAHVGHSKAGRYWGKGR